MLPVGRAEVLCFIHPVTRKVGAMVLRFPIVIVALVVFSAVLSWPASDSSLVLAQIPKVAEGVKTVSFKTTSQVAGNPKMTTTSMILVPHRQRKILANGHIAVVDVKQGKGLKLDPKNKTAFNYTLEANPDLNLYEEVRKFDEKKATRVPERDMDDKRVVGFRVDEKHEESGVKWTEVKTFWFDARTGHPARFERSVIDGEGRTVLRAVSTDFQVNQPLDEKLFQLDVPTGYAHKDKPESTLRFQSPRFE